MAEPFFGLLSLLCEIRTVESKGLRKGVLLIHGFSSQDLPMTSKVLEFPNRVGEHSGRVSRAS